MIIEKVTGESYEVNVRRHIFMPLHMDASGFDFAGQRRIDKAVGYQILDEETVQPDIVWDSTVAYSAGGIYSTPRDMIKWAKAVANKQILSGDSWQKALKPGLHEYGLGWETGLLGKTRYISHSGGLPGFSSHLMIIPEQDIQIIGLSNVHERTIVTPLSQALASMLLNHREVPEIRLQDTAIQWTSRQANEFAGKYALDSQHDLAISANGGFMYIQSVPTNLKELDWFQSIKI